MLYLYVKSAEVFSTFESLGKTACISSEECAAVDTGKIGSSIAQETAEDGMRLEWLTSVID